MNPLFFWGSKTSAWDSTTDLLTSRPEDWMTPEIAARLAVEKARLAKARAIHLHASQLTPNVIDFVFAHKLTIHCWDVNDLARYDFIKSLGIEQFTTDNLHLFLDRL